MFCYQLTVEYSRNMQSWNFESSRKWEANIKTVLFSTQIWFRTFFCWGKWKREEIKIRKYSSRLTSLACVLAASSAAASLAFLSAESCRARARFCAILARSASVRVDISESRKIDRNRAEKRMKKIEKKMSTTTCENSQLHSFNSNNKLGIAKRARPFPCPRYETSHCFSILFYFIIIFFLSFIDFMNLFSVFSSRMDEGSNEDLKSGSFIQFRWMLDYGWRSLHLAKLDGLRWR